MAARLLELALCRLAVSTAATPPAAAAAPFGGGGDDDVEEEEDGDGARAASLSLSAVCSFLPRVSRDANEEDGSQRSGGCSGYHRQRAQQDKPHLNGRTDLKKNQNVSIALFH